MPRPDAPTQSAPPESGTPANVVAPKEATLVQVAGAVLWSFFGIRKGQHMTQDAVTIKPLQVVVVGVILAVMLVFALIALVSFITRNLH